ncbi:hypothetical protein PMAYCL1PPCAC_29375 [Pristionchus mayeri]|uniref:Apple domain-containing protein n=1 Tax=Pristionchus mayeri TaxID=1317129 RepID=A0AAN5DAR0_9BILA|nr:hypothetical protein PMAYCL1PPCAC_29375 [Pristionchus mayeri]
MSIWLRSLRFRMSHFFSTSPLAPTITRYCTNHDNTEFDGEAVLYEESRFCGRGQAINVTGIGMVECMQLCITHPTKSCDAVSYDEALQMCSVFEGGKVERVEGNCSFLALNMVTFDTDKEFIEKLGDQITAELLSRKGKGRGGKKGESRRKKDKVSERERERERESKSISPPEGALEVKTVCMMDAIRIIGDFSWIEMREVFVKDRSSLLQNRLDPIRINEFSRFDWTNGRNAE